MSTFLNQDDCNDINVSGFPDGQPHLKILSISGEERTIRCRITNPTDLVRVGLAVEVLKSHRFKVKLEILYLMGGRMDRRISDREPYTLKVVCNTVNAYAADSVRVFAPHSKTTVDLLNNYDEHFDCFAEESFYDMAAMKAVVALSDKFDYYKDEGAVVLDAEMRNLVRQQPISFIFPDEGAMKRYSKGNLLKWWSNANLVTLTKDRELSTGKIKGMKIVDGVQRDICIIIDDLCDGGATFQGAAECLKPGASKVGLIVAHGIFSKGLPIKGVDWVGTTNSFRNENVGADYFYEY